MRPIPGQTHTHHFNQHLPRAGEQRTWWVIIITALMMGGEIAAGIIYGSMALLADGLHMASHATALLITAIAYAYARRHAHDERFSFGTGKVGSLAAFTSAVLLALFAVVMAAESINRFIHPVTIAFNEAILVAILGLAVNAASVWILNVRHAHDHDHDHNLQAAYLHVLADALTSLLAIFALFTGKYLGLTWMDPLMGIVGAVLVTRWSVGLLKDSGRALLDRQASENLLTAVRSALEKDGKTIVTDLHIWSIGGNQFSAAISLSSTVSDNPNKFHACMAPFKQIVHLTIEVMRVNPT
ncbi:MAG: cation transporter [Calditrichales bacterium]|nr:MAG: cation transporter [Calditrichales bacterium]